jgi:hypothetical protein
MLGKPVRVAVNDKIQKGYVYWRPKPIGRDFRPGFKPELTPKEMLALGVFGGKYITDCRREFPVSWFRNAKLCAERHEPSLNYFKVNASQPLSVWCKKGWIYHEDRLVPMVLSLRFPHLIFIGESGRDTTRDKCAA